MSKPKTINPKVRWVGEITLDLIEKEFYGTLEICFEKGIPTRVVKTESIKPPKEAYNGRYQENVRR